MSGIENKINKLSTRLYNLEKKFNMEFNYSNENNDNVQSDYVGDMSVNLLGFQNIQIANSGMIDVEDETLKNVLWEYPIIKNGVAFGGIDDDNFIINVSGENVFYEFIITANWDTNYNGFRNLSLEDPNGKIVNSSFIPDGISKDIDDYQKHQVIFKQDAQINGGWKVKLYQNSGSDLKCIVNMKVIGPFIY